jgi:hypothetical protein
LSSNYLKLGTKIYLNFIKKQYLNYLNKYYINLKLKKYLGKVRPAGRWCRGGSPGKRLWRQQLCVGANEWVVWVWNRAHDIKPNPPIFVRWPPISPPIVYSSVSERHQWIYMDYIHRWHGHTVDSMRPVKVNPSSPYIHWCPSQTNEFNIYLSD